MKKPNFFIVGAVRSGTTAMYTFLKQHPEVFMSHIKEPFFFGSDLQPVGYQNLQEYLSLFTAVKDEKRIGEASTGYLVSKCAAVEIKKFNPSASIIIMLRNPVDVLYSWHNYNIWTGIEDLPNLEDVLRVEEERKEKRKQVLRLPYNPGRRGKRTYREFTEYTQQVKRYFDAFGFQKVHVIIYDDFKSDISQVYRETLHFLDVDCDFQPDFQRINQNMKVSYNELHNFIANPPKVIQSITHRIMPRCLRIQIFAIIRRLNTKPKPRSPMDPQLKKRLQTEFAPEVEQLSELLGRDLTHWSKD